MVVQHNLQAMNANRMLNVTTGSQSKSAEKLSSGYRINRAADDAAGLTISEKMRKQIRGLDQASSNAEDGVSAVQTAEGALTEVHSMLQRMNELAVQASNGTNSEDDRKAIQDEIEQLTTEIDRVAETTKFNETYLLKGDVDGATTTKTLNAHDAGLKGTLTDAGTGTAKFKVTLADGDKVTIGGKEYEIDSTSTTSSTLKITDAANTAASFGVAATPATKATTTIDLTGWTTGDTIKVGGTEYTQANNNGIDDVVAAVKGALTANWDVSKEGSTLKIVAKEAGAKTAVAITDVKVGGTAVAVNKTDGTDATDAYSAFADEAEMKAAINKGLTIYKGDNTTLAADTDFTYEIKGSKITAEEAYKLMNDELTAASSIGADTKAKVVNDGAGEFTITEGTTTTADKLSFNLHVGADADMTNKINVDVDAMSAAALGIKGINVSDDSGKAATYAVDAIADALSKVSSQRSALGAIQNRLEHTIDNLDNVVENTTSAESRIRDVDMAEEMVEYSKNNILAQAGQSMLAQANQATQGVLSLLG